MAQTPRIFAQAFPPANSATVIYIVAAGHEAQLTVFISNHSNTFDNVSVALVPSSNNSVGTQNYIAYNTPLIGNGVLAFSGISLGSGDSLYVTSTFGTSSFTATGMDFS